MPSSSISEGSTPLRIKDYFHGLLRREFVEDRLENDGDFLVRQSSTQSSLWVISVRSGPSVHHIQPTYDGRHFSFGTKKFTEYEDLIKYHWKKQIPINDALMLRNPVKKQKIAYEASDVVTEAKLGEGQFGEVLKVKIVSEDRPAAMKVLKQEVDATTQENFAAEMGMMVSLRHRNIVGFIGVVDDREHGQMKLLLELSNKGSLDKLLAKARLTDAGKLRVLTHIARGMEYLHQRHVIHRDLAARNILIHKNSDNTVVAKVSDFGLSRADDSEHRGYELRHTQHLPVKWMAPECFTRQHWTMASDAWSYGVLMWEVFTNGADPYFDRPESGNMAALSKFIAEGGHPCELKDINRDMHALMVSCWQRDPAMRPTMSQIVRTLESLFPAYAEKVCKSGLNLPSTGSQR